jgi:hypothetical protein
MASKMNRVATQQVLRGKGWNGDHFSVELLDRASDSCQILLVRKNREVRIAAKLRPAV